MLFDTYRKQKYFLEGKVTLGEIFTENAIWIRESCDLPTHNVDRDLFIMASENITVLVQKP